MKSFTTTSISVNLFKEFSLTISSFVIAFGVVLSQENETHVVFKLGMFLIALGFIFFTSATKFLNKLLLSTPYGLQFIYHFKLSLSDCVDISNKLISALQALLSCFFGAIICAHSCRRNFLTTSHIFSEAYAYFGAAYFLYDVWSMYVVHVTKIYDKLKMKDIDNKEHNLYDKIPSLANGELKIFNSTNYKSQEIPSFVAFTKCTKLMTFHHMFIGIYGLIIISSWRGGLGDCIFSFMFMMELSTPFVSFRAILSMLQMKKSKLYVINGILMILTFLCFRIAMLPLLMYKYSSIVSLSMYEAILRLPLMCQLSIIALFLPQFYWFFLMIKIALKMFNPPKEKISTHNKME
ncbi:hypothetical protein PVAND_003559 [Polypedilum vanderplanki]|uniref:TLC domain-containing protein n=1 Tax=Polypedilum vanderplanki TaxID=319348 RepID=A0A9J6BVH4_POLVA|nr:hypothetical protein PVAND_003559 [Polypedilum vanderplanki]